MTRNYQDLKQVLGRGRFFDAQPVYYALVVGGTLAALACSLWIFTWARGPIAILLNTAFFSFVSVQLGFLMHDAGHHAIFRRSWTNELAGMIFGDLLNGLPFGWWAPHHGRHHAHPNHDELDPDLPTLRIALALSEEEARQARVIAAVELLECAQIAVGDAIDQAPLRALDHVDRHSLRVGSIVVTLKHPSLPLER